VLAHQNIAAWIPLVLPNAKLVMPGHTYPIQLQTILPSSDFELRMQLFNAINSSTPNINYLAKQMLMLNVELLVLPDGVDPVGIHQLKNIQYQITIKKIDSVAGYSLFHVSYGVINGYF